MQLILFQFLNMLPVWILNYCCSVLTVYSCVISNRKFKWVSLCMFLKLFLVNMIWDICILNIIEKTTVGLWINITYQVSAYVFFIILCKRFLQITWEKFAVIFIIADVRAMFCGFVPVIFVSWLFHYNIIENISSAPTIYNLCIVPFSVLLILLTQKLGKKFFNYIKAKKIKHIGFWKCVLVFYMGGGISSSCNVGLYYPFVFVIIFSAFVICFFVIYGEKKKQLLEVSNRYLLLQRDMILQYHESLKDQIDLTKKMRHDINNHMQIIESIRKENSTEELEAYTKKLREQYEQLEPVYYCDNVVINALIANKAEKCRREDIRFEAQLEKLTLGEITEYDLASVLFNLLDNAIESCQKVEDETKRFIRLSCYTESGQMLIHVVNGCVEKESDEKKRFFTSKPDKKRHGLGMGIIQENIRKYPGAGMTINHRDYKFEIMIHIPLRNDG